MPTRREILQTSIGGLALSACGPSPKPEAAEVRGNSTGRRPNILFVLADDQSWPHASIYGSRASKTPAFDRIAREGALFTHSFCASPSCTPSRSAILTGRNIWQLGEAGVLYGTIAANETLFPHLLADAGYVCGFTGKGWAPGDWRAAGLARHPIGKEYNARKHSVPVAPGIDQRDFAANFEDFLKERPANGAPFFFWLGSTEPHRVYDPGGALRAGRDAGAVEVPAFLPDTPEIRSDLLDYHAEIDWYDRQLARTLAALEKTGELENTLVIVTSDNGMPFPRAKVNLYDAGTHMPLAMRWGARIRPGQRIDDLASHTDFAPTVLAAAGLPVPATMDGRNLVVPVESGAAAAPAPREFVYTALERHTYCRPDGAPYPMRAIRSRQYLYIRNFAPDRWPTGGPDFTSSNKTFHGDVDGAPTKDFLTAPAQQRRFAREYALAFGKRPGEEFYDVVADPGQVRNLAGEAAAASQLARHRAALEAYLRQTADPRMQGKDPWQAYPYRQSNGYGAQFNTALTPEQRRQSAEAAAHKPE